MATDNTVATDPSFVWFSMEYAAACNPAPVATIEPNTTICRYPYAKGRSRCSRRCSDVGTTKYTHHMPNVRPVPATATRTASIVQPRAPTTADNEATVPSTPTPTAMIASSP